MKGWLKNVLTGKGFVSQELPAVHFTKLLFKRLPQSQTVQ